MIKADNAIKANKTAGSVSGLVDTLKTKTDEFFKKKIALAQA